MKTFSILSRRIRFSLLITPALLLSVAAALVAAADRKPNAVIWEDINDRSLDSVALQQIVPSAYRTLRLNKSALAQALARAPMEFTREATENPAIIRLPLPDGTMARFRFEESPIMESALARQHPEIKTYSGQGIDDTTATARFDQTPFGLHAIVLSRDGTVFIEPVSQSDPTTYISYFNHDVSTEGLTLSCLLSDAEIAEAEQRAIHSNQEPVTPDFITGPTLRTYRLAVAATGEFTQQYGGGDVNATLAKIVTLINQVDALYRKEATITFQLVANETSIIFTDPVTDGYTNASPSTMLAENQAKLDMVIGSANYDIGHVFGGRASGFSGVASLGVPCSGSVKGRGVSTMGGGVSSFPPAIFVSLVSHEIGHQFSARHTFNSTMSGCSGNRDSAGAYEPGSGSTILGYSTCGSDNLQTFPDLYFHTGSLERIAAYSSGAGNCASTTATGNNAPSIATLSNFTIPAITPFTLTANVTDPDGDALTCVWEEFDLGAASPPNTDDGTRPLFRSYIPASSPARTFPRLQYILNNANVPPSSYTCGGGTCLTGEVLPSTTRTMNFRFTARDNRAAAGGVANAPMQVSVSSTAGPFVVTQPNITVSWTAGSMQPVAWSVANTANAPINCTNVKISLSTDGGNTFPFTLAASTPNDGNETVIVPNLPTTTARIKVEAVGNIFFDISDANFTIAGTTQTPTPTATPTPPPIPTATPTATPIPTATPTPTPITISGSVSYCSNPALNPVPNVTITLTGSSGGTTLSDASGNYAFASLPSGGSYTVTPTKAALTPGGVGSGINTIDIIATQRHFLEIALLSGCRLTAADVNGDTAVSTVDVIAIQRFFIGETTGIANVGQYKFIPVSRSYPGVTNQTGQNYDTLVHGDVASPFAE